MKPSVFIGSSVENLTIANTLQLNLEYDGNVTVWNQGVFSLSSNALKDLTNALANFDFAIFVFQPDDMTTMRNVAHNTVRDNIIFELGLFIGKLGREKFST
jgi:predicted nucleotide-binding protein